MGFLSFRRCRKAPSPLDIPDCSLIPQAQSTLLDQFSQEVGSASSASSWVIPDIINRRVEEQPFSPSELQSPRYSMDSFGGAFLGLRGGNMDDFDDCDPNSPTALEKYQDWIDQDSQDEQSSLRQRSQESLDRTRQVSPCIESGANPGISLHSPQQALTLHTATTRLYPHVFRPPPLVDGSDDDEVPDASSRHCRCSRKRTFIIGSDDDQELHSPGIYSPDFVVVDNEEVAEYLDDFRDLPHVDDYVNTYRSPNYPAGAVMDDNKYDADFEDSQTIWNSNNAILQGSDLADSEDFDNWSETWELIAPANPSGPSPEASRPFNASELLDRPASAGSVYEDALEELPILSIDPSQLSPTSPYNDDAHHRREFFSFEQYRVPTAGHYPFSPDFARPIEPRDIHARLQCPPEFNYSWVNPDPLCQCGVTYRYIRLIYELPTPRPTIFGWAAFGYPAPRITMRYGRPHMLIFISWSRDPRRFNHLLNETPFPRESFGNGMHDRFTFTFTSDEPSFPPQPCFCRNGMRCRIHPLGRLFVHQLL